MSESNVRPHFTILVDLEDGAVVDASLSPESRAFLQKQAEIRRSSAAGVEFESDGSDQPMPDAVVEDVTDTNSAETPAAPVANGSAPSKSLQRVEVSLNADSEFFELIYRDTAVLERIGQAERDAITAEVVALGREVSAVAQPERKRKMIPRLGLSGSSTPTVTYAADAAGAAGAASAEDMTGTLHTTDTASDAKPTHANSVAVHHKYASDLSRWRELFELYLDAQVFFSTRERYHGRAHASDEASRQLDWFQERVRQRGLLQQFQLGASRAAYRHFLLLNKRLYLNLRFRELNQTAQSKILKSRPPLPQVRTTCPPADLPALPEFDKWTALGVSRTFPDALSHHHHDLLVEGLARDVCARIAEDVVAVVPRLEDYTCPVCLGLAWLPVRLRCRHVFCVRCVIKMQRDGRKVCPLCRDEAVMEADLDNLDADLEKFLKLYFRREAKEKQQANELERGVELFGQGYKPSTCVLM